jgi:hypothetical protein
MVIAELLDMKNSVSVVESMLSKELTLCSSQNDRNVSFSFNEQRLPRARIEHSSNKGGTNPLPPIIPRNSLYNAEVNVISEQDNEDLGSVPDWSSNTLPRNAEYILHWLGIDGSGRKELCFFWSSTIG